MKPGVVHFLLSVRRWVFFCVNFSILCFWCCKKCVIDDNVVTCFGMFYF